jgi:Kelch motif protein
MGPLYEQAEIFRTFALDSGGLKFFRPGRSRKPLRCANMPPGVCRAAARAMLFILISVALGLFEVQGSGGAPSNFSFAGSLAKERYAHAATLLPSGKVLVAGGSDGTSTILSAEVYDPATDSWAATGSLVAFSFAAPAIVLQNGKILLPGGGPGTAQLYDATTGSWSATGSLNVARRAYTATLLPSGKVLVAGGSDPNGTSVGSAETYDPVAGSWKLTGLLAVSRSDHTATLLPDG